MADRYGFARYLAGATAARTGDEMSGPAILLVGLSATGSPAVGSALLAGLMISSGVAGPILGAVLDRSPAPGRLLAVALAAYAGGLAVVAALVGGAPTALVVGLAVVAGTAAPALTGAWTAQVPRVLHADRVPRGFSLDAATYGAASLAGPALAGVVATVMGARWAVTLAVVLLVAAVPVALRLPRGRSAPCSGDELAAAEPPGRDDAAAAPRGAALLVADLIAGLRAIVERRALLAVTVASMVSSAGVAGFVVATPLLGEQLAGRAAAGTVLLSAVAVGSLLGAGLLARRPWRGAPERLLVLTTLVVGAMFAVLAAAGSFALALAAAAVAGVAEGPQLASVVQVRHREAPAALRSQLFTTAASVKMSAYAVGAAGAGVLASRSATACLVAAAALQVAAAGVALTARARRRPEARTAPA